MFLFFFFNDTATTEIYTLSLHDALPICWAINPGVSESILDPVISDLDFVLLMSVNPGRTKSRSEITGDRKSTRLNSSHVRISYAVFCLKKKKLDMERMYTPHNFLYLLFI